MKTEITYQFPPSYDFILPDADPNRLSQQSYVKKYIHKIDFQNFITYFYPSGYNVYEGFVFEGAYTLEKVLEKLPEEFQVDYYKKFIR